MFELKSCPTALCAQQKAQEMVEKILAEWTGYA